MSSLERKFKRANNKKSKKKAEKELAKRVDLFGKLPENCLTCEKEFDKKNKEHVSTWNVIVREEEEIVRLYCPDCWTKAVGILNDFAEHLKNKLSGEEEISGIEEQTENTRNEKEED